jgi:HPt (histidine-containing phosphotransfer) domain-containing protein
VPGAEPQAALRLDEGALVRLRRTMGGDAGLRLLLADFLSGAERLAPALVGTSRTEAVRAAHTLKSMARILGVQPLEEACRRLEHQGAQADPGQYRRMQVELLGQLAAAQASVRSWLAS